MQRRLSKANAQQDSSSPVKGQSQKNISLGNMFELLNNSHYQDYDNQKKNSIPNRALSNNRKHSPAVNGIEGMDTWGQASKDKILYD